MDVYTNANLRSKYKYMYENTKSKCKYTSGACEGRARCEGLTVNLFTHKLAHTTFNTIIALFKFKYMDDYTNTNTDLLTTTLKTIIVLFPNTTFTYNG